MKKRMNKLQVSVMHVFIAYPETLIPVWCMQRE